MKRMRVGKESHHRTAIAAPHLAVALWLATTCLSFADTLEGPTSVQETLEGGDGIPGPQYRTWFLTDFFIPWFGFKDELNEAYNLSVGWDYTVVGQVTTSDFGEDGAIGHDLRFYGNWTPVNPGGPNSGSLTVKVESRLGYTAVAPQNLGFASGAAAITAAQFSDAGWVLTNTYWKQRLFDDRVALVIGQIDVTDYMDLYALANPVSQFQNIIFSISPTIAAPSQGLGAGAGVWLSPDHVYINAGFADLNADPHDPFQSAEDFFSVGEIFKFVELGYTSSRQRTYLDNIHVTYWHADERTAAGVPDGWGLSFSAAWTFEDRWLPFLRAGYAEDGGALYDRSVSIGVGYLTPWSDLIGIGLNWARPQGFSGEQWTLEAFYRYQVSREFAVTFDVQLITDPALDPARDINGYFGLRTRLAL